MAQTASDRAAGLIRAIHGPKEDEISVGLVFIDSSSKADLSITGRASVIRDAEGRCGERWTRCGGRAAQMIRTYPC